MRERPANLSRSMGKTTAYAVSVWLLRKRGRGGLNPGPLMESEQSPFRLSRLDRGMFLHRLQQVQQQDKMHYFGNYRLRDITAMQVQALMAALSSKSKSLQSKVLAILRNIFCIAQENGLVAKSPVSVMLRAGGKKTQEKIALTPEESELLLSRIKNKRAKTFAMIALNTGMRRGEIIALRWKDIDFREKIIHVSSNALVKEGKTEVDAEVKTPAAIRNIPLPEALEKWLLQQKPLSHSQFVVAMENHQALTKSSFRSMWRLVERELPNKHLTAHILRHTYITRLFEAGLDIKEVQYLAGHSTVDMTLRVYTHYDRQSREKQTIEKVREAFRKESA